MKKILTLLLMMFMLTMSPATGQAVVLLEIPHNSQFTLQGNLPEIFDVLVYFEGALITPMFDLAGLTTANSGDLYTISAGDPAFDNNVNFFTDGNDGVIWSSHTYFGGVAGNAIAPLESAVNSTNPFSLNGIDLQGNVITSLQLSLGSIVYTQTAANGLTHGEISSKLIVNGEPSGVVPEPASMFLFGAGAVGAFLKRRKV